MVSVWYYWLEDKHSYKTDTKQVTDHLSGIALSSQTSQNAVCSNVNVWGQIFSTRLSWSFSQLLFKMRQCHMVLLLKYTIYFVISTHSFVTFYFFFRDTLYMTKKIFYAQLKSIVLKGG